MDLMKLPLLETMRSRMTFLSSRQTVLADNVANANTPNYRAKDVEEPDFAALTADQSSGTQMTVTDPRHISTNGNDGLGGFKMHETPDSEGTPNGNSVVLEDQMMKISAIQTDYATVTQLYKKALSMIRLAAGAQR